MAGLKLRVLDVSDGIAGPYCARLLADYGADVIKIEPPEGDSSRREGFVKDDVSVLYTYINQNKRGITADLETASGQAILKRLVETADIMVESFAPGTLDRLGLGYQELKAINPRLVLVSLTHFGQTGPYRDYKATHFTTHALSSWLTGVGDPDKPPVQMGYPVFYYKTGVNGAIGALAAIRGRRLTGKGQHVDVSVFETCGDLAGESLAVSFKIPEMKRRRRVPDFIKAKDGWIGLTVGNFEEWKNVWLLANMLDVLDEPDLIQDEVKREQRRPELEARLNDWGKDKTREEIFFAAQELRVGGGIAYSPGETLACQQFVERDFFVKTTHPKLGEYKQPRAPFVSPFSLTESRPAPDLGEHNEEVFAEIGLDREGRETSSPTAQSQQAPNPSGTDGGGDLLAGMRVLDLTHWWSGPFVTWLLGALGADVIKIEAQQRPDPYRFLFAGKADVPNWIERGYLWNNTNVNKRGITLDLASEKGKDLFLEMVKESDLVVENFSPRVMRNLGLEYEKLREINPKIVMISMSCYGQTGPWHNFKGYGPNFEMISGASFLTGYDMEDHPQRTALPDPVSGAFGAFATLMALEIRDLVGSGQYIDVSQTEALATFIGQQVIEYQLTGETPVRIANRHPIFAPHNLYPCEGEDNWVAIAVTTDEEWASLARLLGKPQWTQDARFATAQDRKQVEDEIDEVISEWTRGQNKRAAMEVLQSVGIPSGAVQRGRDLLTDPHLRARKYFKKLPREYIGEHEYPETPWHFSDTVCEHRFAAPTLGQHTDEVLCEFGLSPEEIEKLREEKVI